jgi:hypothetical protein
MYFQLVLIFSWTVFVFLAMHVFRSKPEENDALELLNKIKMKLQFFQRLRDRLFF